jgi:hypothetical protein
MKIHKLSIILFILIRVGGFATTAQENRWLSYEPAVVELEGKLIVESKYGPPNYGENPRTDSKVRIRVLVVSKPVNVRGNPQDALNKESLEGIRRIQLNLFNLKTPYKQLIGKRVVVSGTLSHAITGHDYTKVVMDVHSIREKPSR